MLRLRSYLVIIVLFSLIFYWISLEHEGRLVFGVIFLACMIAIPPMVVGIHDKEEMRLVRGRLWKEWKGWW